MTTQLVIYWILLLSNYKLIATDLSKQTKLKDPQQINFIGKLGILEQQCFLSSKNQKKLLLIFYKTLSQSYKQWKHKNL